MTRVLVNGRADAAIDPMDRGVQYGDGVFETFAVKDGRARFFDWHFERLADGARRLALPVPDARVLQDEIAETWPRGRGVVKLVLTRGIGARGYRPPAVAHPTRIVTAHEWPSRDSRKWSEGVRVRLCRMRLGRNSVLAGIKHLNRLEQVLARAEWDDGAMDEGLLLDDRDRLIGGTMSNVFVFLSDRWLTPVLSDCGVAGVMRRAFRGWAAEQGIAVMERDIAVADLAGVSAMLLTNSLIGAWPVRVLAGGDLPPDPLAVRFNAWLETQ
jgi:4-amino-4-deoxychorismate lyase